MTHDAGEEYPHEPHHGYGEQGHSHGAVEPSIATSERGIWAVKWSFVGLFVTALLQAAVVALSGSVALLSDTIHNIGDAATALPLWIAFALNRLGTSRRFTFGYGRVEDLAGVIVVLIILFSAVVVGYQAVERIVHPQPVGLLWAVAAAALVGFIGNEAVGGNLAFISGPYGPTKLGWCRGRALAPSSLVRGTASFSARPICPACSPVSAHPRLHAIVFTLEAKSPCASSMTLTGL